MTEILNDPQLRVFLWTQPRSLGTVLSKCMSFFNGVQIIKEPMLTAHSYGPDSKSLYDLTDTVASDLMSGDDGNSMKYTYDHKIASFKWTKQMLERPFPGKSFVFVHDQAYSIHKDRYGNLPRGYRHTFLIRNPIRVFPSWKKLIETLMPSTPFVKQSIRFLPPKRGIGELFDLYQYAKQEFEESPIIIDADDLQTYPKSILSQYCKLIGIEFKESILEWEIGDHIVDNWLLSDLLLKGNKSEIGGFYEKAFKSTKFSPPPELPSIEEIDDELRPMIDQCMPVYKQLYSQRIQP